MINFLTTRDHVYTLENPRAAIGPAIGIRTYEWLFGQNKLPGGTWVFSDHDRLAGYELSWAAVAATALEAAGMRILNRPANVLNRYELLLKLKMEGFNCIGAWRANEMPHPDRFPVLLKSDNDHLQAHVALIADQSALESKLAELRRLGVPLRHLLVISYANEPIRNETWRKHSVFRVGDRFLSYSPVIEDNWAVKYGKVGHSTDEELTAAVREMDDNPFASMMKPVFDTAGIDYGRVDFGFANDRPVIYEINTNPSVPKPMLEHRRQDYADANNRVLDRIHAAILELDTDGPSVNITWPGKARAFGLWHREFVPLRP